MTASNRGAETPDEEIVRRVVAGDAAATAILFDRHLPRIRAMVNRRIPAALRPKVAASDVVQEAWTAAFQRLSEFEDRGAGSFGRWLRRIVDHKAVDEVRRHTIVGKRDARRDVRMRTGEEPRAVGRGRASPPSEVAAAERSEIVRRAIANLSSDDRAVLRSIQEDCLTTAEAGARMGRSADATRKLYARALGRLADELRRLGVSDT